MGGLLLKNQANGLCITKLHTAVQKSQVSQKLKQKGEVHINHEQL
jgi:hypothetical protein